MTGNILIEGKKENPCFKAAINYLTYGLSPIPCYLPWKDEKHTRAHKKCYIKWGQFQNRIAELEEIIDWWTQYPMAQLGIVNGKISDVFTLDLDVGYDRQEIEKLNLPKDTWIDQTPSGGYHVYFKYPKDREIGNCTGLFKNVDIRAEGGIVVIPPSTYRDGRPYKWINSPDKYTLKDAPESLLNLISNGKTKREFKKFINGAGSGIRNNSATQIAGKLLRAYHFDDWFDFCWPLLRAWNEWNKPPLEEEELFTTFKSIAQKHMEGISLDNLNK